MGIAAFIFTIVGILTIMGLMARLAKVPLNKILEAVNKTNEELVKLNENISKNEKLDKEIITIHEAIDRINKKLSDSDL